MNKAQYAKKQQLMAYPQKVINRTKSKAKAQKESDIRTGKLKISKARRTKKK